MAVRTRRGGREGRGAEGVLELGRVKLGTFRMWMAWKREGDRR